MSGLKPPKGGSDSGISDFDGDLKRKVRESRGSVPVARSDNYTPITNIEDLGSAISAIKRGQDRTADAVDNLDKSVQHDIKPKLNKVHEGFIRLETEHKTTKVRLRVLETDTKEAMTTPAAAHGCYHEDEIVDLKDGFKEARAGIATTQTNIATVNTEHKRCVGGAFCVGGGWWVWCGLLHHASQR